MTCDFTEMRDFVFSLEDYELNQLISIIQERQTSRFLGCNSFEEYAFILGREPKCPFCNNDYGEKKYCPLYFYFNKWGFFSLLPLHSRTYY